MQDQMNKVRSKGITVSSLLVRKQKSQMRNSIDRHLIIEEEDQINNS
jgi:hypothetical protein